MNLKTQADENKYVDALKKLVAKQNNRPCMEWQCKESLVKRCDKAPCKWCCYYGCYCCINLDRCISKILEEGKE